MIELLQLNSNKRRAGRAVDGWKVVSQTAVIAGAVFISGGAMAAPPELSPEAKLGKRLFFDTSLSNPAGQACASCHTVDTGFTFPSSAMNERFGVAPGAISSRFGTRAVPQISYAAFGPMGKPHHNHFIGLYVGGLFWDGRADDLVDQAKQPFLNPNEMNNLTHNIGDPSLVVDRVAHGPNAELFKEVFGANVFEQPVATVYNFVAKSIAEYEKSKEVSPFSSKYDAWKAGRAQLTAQEMHGLQLVTGTWTGRFEGAPFPIFAHCADCHMIPNTPATEGPDLWTNTCYQNIGTPKNRNNPFYRQTDAVSNPVGYNPLGEAFLDYGLGITFYTRLGLPPGNVGPGSDGRGDFLGVNGLFKAPSLRNVDRRPYPGFVKAYMHNGVFKSLKDVVHFYNTRNLTTEPGEVINFEDPEPYAHLIGTPLWDPPEHPSPETLVNAPGDLGTLPGTGSGGESSAQVGNLGITEEEEEAIVAFLQTLTDGYYDPDSGTGCISIVSQPVSQKSCLGGSARFTVAGDHPANVRYQWRFNNEPIQGANLPYLWIVSSAMSDQGVYDCILTVPCGAIISNPASLTICQGDFNCDGAVDFFDYLDFVDAFASDDPSAEINGDGLVDLFDYLDFLERFSTSC